VFDSAQDLPIETAEVLTSGGIRSARLIPEPVILAAIAKYKPDLLQACAGAGLRVFLHRLAGFEVTSSSMAPVRSDRELMLEAQLVAANARLETEEVKHELTEAKLLLEQKETYILRSVKDKPGLETLMESSQEFSQLLLPDKEIQANWTIWEWMTVYAKKKFVLEDTDFRKMVSRVHGAYKAVYNKPPRKDYRNQVNNPKANKLVQVYLPEEFGVLEICYRDTVAEVCHN
jgi:hypothetical protein